MILSDSGKWVTLLRFEWEWGGLLVCFAPPRPDNADCAFCWWITVKKPGRKIFMSGGGRCNFTNMYAEPAAYLSGNPHFCKSALARYTQWDFIDLVNRYGIAYHEKTLGQLFCDDSAQQIVDMLMRECEIGNVQFRLRSELLSIERADSAFTLTFANKLVAE